MKLRNLSVSVLCLASVFCFTNAEAIMYVSHVSNNTDNSVFYYGSSKSWPSDTKLNPAGVNTHVYKGMLKNTTTASNPLCVRDSSGFCLINFVDPGTYCNNGKGYQVQAWYDDGEKSKTLCVTSRGSGSYYFIDVALTKKFGPNNTSAFSIANAD
jgi:hypothetical protein